jgi:hypothetical protein
MKKFTLFIASLFLVAGLSAQTVFENLYLLGDATEAGWNNTAAIPLTKVSPGVFTITATLTAPTGNDERFKFSTELGQWDPSVTCQTDVEGHETVVLGQEHGLVEKANQPDGYDNAFQVAVTGEYKIDVDLNTYTMTVVDASTVGINDISKESAPFSIISKSATIGIVMDNSSVAESFEIYNIGGSLVYSKSNIDGSYYAESGFAPGIYVVRVSSNNKVYSLKVVVR